MEILGRFDAHMNNLIHFFLSGGIFMIPMVICSIVGLAIIIERTLALRRAKMSKPETPLPPRGLRAALYQVRVTSTAARCAV